MKIYSKHLLFILMAAVFMAACTKDEVEEPETPVPVQDKSLIIAQNSYNEYVIVSPTSGEVKAAVQPNVIGLQNWALGYQSTKAVITSKEPGGSFVKVIYTCDRETGNNLFQVTSELDWDVLHMDISPVGPQIVFAAQDVDNLSDDQVHRINEDGSGYQQLTFKDEGVECPGKIATKMVFAYMPSWSPNGTKIAFDGKLREIDENHPHDAIIIMDANGNNKEVLYSVPVEEADYKDICWTRDGKFLVFLTVEGGDRKVKVLNINTKTIQDISNHLMVSGLYTTNLWTSPDENKIVFNKYEPGGGDLYVIKYSVSETNQFIINGSYTMLASRDLSGYHYGAPDWQPWPSNN